jgi:hypothetical protein
VAWQREISTMWAIFPQKIPIWTVFKGLYLYFSTPKITIYVIGGNKNASIA